MAWYAWYALAAIWSFIDAIDEQSRRNPYFEPSDYLEVTLLSLAWPVRLVLYVVRRVSDWIESP
jgi:hypothetical protein